MKINSFVDEAKKQAEKANGVFKGAIVHISVSTGSANIKQSDIRNAIQSCKSIPESWLPDVHNNLTLYLQTITEMNKAGLKNFILPNDLSFNVEEHAGYSSDRVYKKAHDKYPTAHKIFRKIKFSGEIEDSKNSETRAVTDVAHSPGIKIMLERTVGTHADDATGKSEFDLIIDPEYPEQDISEYQPYILTLKQRFNDKINGVYESRQIRDIVLDIIKGQVNAISIQTGLYFVKASSIDPVYELAEAMQKVCDGIRIQTIPVIEFKDAPILNKHVEEVRVSLSESILSEVKKFCSDIDVMEDEDSGTRDSTWLKKLGEVKKYKSLLEELENDNMLVLDVIREMLESAEENIIDKI